eukprot:193012-Karenia_brevis.AAC.1
MTQQLCREWRDLIDGLLHTCVMTLLEQDEVASTLHAACRYTCSWRHLLAMAMIQQLCREWRDLTDGLLYTFVMTL